MMFVETTTAAPTTTTLPTSKFDFCCFVCDLRNTSRACCLVLAAAVFVFLDQQFGTIFL